MEWFQLSTKWFKSIKVLIPLFWFIISVSARRCSSLSESFSGTQRGLSTPSPIFFLLLLLLFLLCFDDIVLDTARPRAANSSGLSRPNNASHRSCWHFFACGSHTSHPLTWSVKDVKPFRATAAAAVSKDPSYYCSHIWRPASRASAAAKVE